MNLVSFHGVLTYVDIPSNRPPSGTHGHKVLLRRSLIAERLQHFQGLPVNCSGCLTRHEQYDQAARIGVVHKAIIKGNAVIITGFLDPDVPRSSVVFQAKEPLGMSYEIKDARIADMNKPIWEVVETRFVGISIALQRLAAYNDTWIKISKQVAERTT